MNKKQNDFIKDLINADVSKSGLTLTAALKNMAPNIGVSYVTLYNIVKDRHPCSSKTLEKILSCDWQGKSSDVIRKEFESLDSTPPPPSNKNSLDQASYDAGYNSGLKEGKKEYDKAFKAGYKKGIGEAASKEREGYDKGYELGYATGRTDGIEEGTLYGRTISGGSSRSSARLRQDGSIDKLKKLINLKNGSSGGEANAAGKAAAGIISKILREQLSVDVNVSVN